MNQMTDTASLALLAGEAGFDPIEERLRTNVRATIEAGFEEELAGLLGRLRCGRGEGAAKGYRHGHRERQLTGTFGTETVRVPRARIEDETGKVDTSGNPWRCGCDGDSLVGGHAQGGSDVIGPRRVLGRAGSAA
jgi:hypothetical protein